ncbi:MAG: hypothetical protein ACFFCW_39265 [Candidatus Hodarchaeota archaeon]
MKLAIIVASIIIAVAIVLSNGIYVPMAPSHYLNKFTGECFNVYGKKFAKTEGERRSADDPLNILKDESNKKETR